MSERVIWTRNEDGELAAKLRQYDDAHGRLPEGLLDEAADVLEASKRQLAEMTEERDQLHAACRKAALALIVFPDSVQKLIDDAEFLSDVESREISQWSDLGDAAYAAIEGALNHPVPAEQEESHG